MRRETTNNLASGSTSRAHDNSMLDSEFCVLVFLRNEKNVFICKQINQKSYQTASKRFRTFLLITLIANDLHEHFFCIRETGSSLVQHMMPLEWKWAWEKTDWLKNKTKLSSVDHHTNIDIPGEKIGKNSFMDHRGSTKPSATREVYIYNNYIFNLELGSIQSICSGKN